MDEISARGTTVCPVGTDVASVRTTARAAVAFAAG